MKEFAMIDATTGAVKRICFCSIGQFDSQKPGENEILFNGTIDPESQYYRDGEIHTLTEEQMADKISRPSEYHRWDWLSLSWMLSIPQEQIDEIEKQKERAKRNSLLAASDWTQVNDSPISDDQKKDWANYRATLRAIPEQLGFPHNIDWPIPPT